MAKAYVEAGGECELLLEDVSSVEVTGKQVRVCSLFGELRELEASIKQVDFQNGRIVLESLS
jgi:predicted RNA-binding protein